MPHGEPSQAEAHQEAGIGDEELAEAVFDIVEGADFDVRPSYFFGPSRLL